MILRYLTLHTKRLSIIFWVFEPCFPLFHSLFTPGLHYGLRRKTTLTTWDLVFALIYFIWAGFVHWLKYEMSTNLHFLRISRKLRKSRNRIMLSPFNLLTFGPWSEIDDAESWDYQGHLCLLLWHVHTGAYPLTLHDDISSYMYTWSPFHLEMFGIDVLTYSTFSLDSSYNRVLSGLARDEIHPYWPSRSVHWGISHALSCSRVQMDDGLRGCVFVVGSPGYTYVRCTYRGIPLNNFMDTRCWEN